MVIYRLTPYLPLLFALLFLFACKSESGQKKATAETLVRFQGQTMGTYYNVQYQDVKQRNLKPAIDSLLIALNNEVSTYEPESVITRFNQSNDTFYLDENWKHFIRNYEASRLIAGVTLNSFDPTVMPLVNFWGFGTTGRRKSSEVSKQQIDSLKALVGLDKIRMGENSRGSFLLKDNPKVQLDFSALAKGYGVDEVGHFLEQAGIENYLVEIGGEDRARGEKTPGQAWRIGINEPKEEGDLSDIKAIVELKNQSIASSGNYRNFYEVDGVKYWHTINPVTGYPEQNTLLSASIFASDCMTADALATASMVMGLDSAYQLISKMSGVEAYFIYGDEDGGMSVKYTEGMEEMLVSQ
jgi:thiamine biosynthesis lipoprotein